jgi:hypothetical protein
MANTFSYTELSRLTLARAEAVNAIFAAIKTAIEAGYTSSEIDALVWDSANYAANSVDYANIQQVAAMRVLGNASGSLANVTELELSNDATMAGNSASSVVTEYAAKGYVDAAIASLIDSSPGALDTLNELAAALGDDANFSTTMTTALAGKLSLSGGTMTGVLNFDGQYATNVPTPTLSHHVAPKSYVDAIAGGLTDIEAAVEAAEAALDEFTDLYLRAKSSDPTLDNDGNALQTGALYWNDVANEMRAYNGTSWQAAASGVNGTLERQVYTATAAQTTFAVTYDVGFVDVWLNGVKLKAGTDFTATNGTSIVLASGATAGDIVDIIAFGAFDVANTVAPSRQVIAGTGLTGGGDLSTDVTLNLDPSAVSTEFSDDDFVIQDGDDDTKEVVFEVDGVTTGTRRTMTIPDKNGTFALTSDIPAASPLTKGTATVLSNDATADFSITSGCDEMVFYLKNVKSITGANDLLVLASDDGGSTYNKTITTLHRKTNGAGTYTTVGTLSSTAGAMITYFEDPKISLPIMGKVLIRPTSDNYTYIRSELVFWNSSTDDYVMITDGYIAHASALTHIRFKFETYNLYSGTIQPYTIGGS